MMSAERGAYFSLSPESRTLLLAIGVVVLGLIIPAPCVAGDLPSLTPLPPPIPDSQNPLFGPAFVGEPATANRLSAKTPYQPSLSLMHADAGNTDASDFPGPLGRNPYVGSATELILVPFLWDDLGRLTTGCVVPQPAQPGGRLFCLAAVDPHTLWIQARWIPPAGQTLQLAYVVMNASGEVAVTTREGHIYVVQRSDGPLGPSFALERDIDLTGVLQAEEILLAALFDSRGNIWFTTGGILGIGEEPPPFTTLGAVDPSGKVQTIHLTDEIVENGFAVNNDTIYVVTGPAGAADHDDAVGYTYAFTTNDTTGAITTAWKESYDAGSVRKPGGFSRGSGATVTLVGDEYVTITDNADDQVHLLVYYRDAVPEGANRLVCRVPLFSPGASAADVSPIAHRNGAVNSIIVANDYNAPPIQLSLSPTDLNGSWNDMNSMAPGLERVDVLPGGSGCQKIWNAPIRIKSVAFLSTATGLIYGYTQDPELADQGTYVWYFVAVDYATGDILWRARAGAGGTKNDSYAPGSLGPDGTFYQSLQLGVVWMRDSRLLTP